MLLKHLVVKTRIQPFPRYHSLRTLWSGMHFFFLSNHVGKLKYSYES
uniref:Uncharacterized protein n=1 Tax=Rhizophora mucronata TaxID=61149 RepID=A0A2P2JN85_RHIMU